MPKRHGFELVRQGQSVGPDLFRGLLIAFGIALLLGLTSGLVWVAYNLIKVQLFR